MRLYIKMLSSGLKEKGGMSGMIEYQPLSVDVSRKTKSTNMTGNLHGTRGKVSPAAAITCNPYSEILIAKLCWC